MNSKCYGAQFAPRMTAVERRTHGGLMDFRKQAERCQHNKMCRMQSKNSWAGKTSIRLKSANFGRFSIRKHIALIGPAGQSLADHSTDDGVSEGSGFVVEAEWKTVVPWSPWSAIKRRKEANTPFIDSALDPTRVFLAGMRGHLHTFDSGLGVPSSEQHLPSVVSGFWFQTAAHLQHTLVQG